MWGLKHIKCSNQSFYVKTNISSNIGASISICLFVASLLWPNMCCDIALISLITSQHFLLFHLMQPWYCCFNNHLTKLINIHTWLILPLHGNGQNHKGKTTISLLHFLRLKIKGLHNHIPSGDESRVPM